MNHEPAVPAGLSSLADDYEILTQIGRGGISVVYLARDRILGREVAIKVIHDRHLDDREARIRADSEARTLAQLHHPNIVTLLGARRLESGALALIMQLARGRTLRAVLKQEGPFSTEAAVAVIRQAATALGYLHRRGIIHRDVKPENLFIEEDGTVLLSDLGIAKANDAPTNVTLTGVVVGTPAYMSPEQIDGEKLDGRSDLYSLGLLGHELLSGRRPWEGENLFKVIIKQKSEALPSLATLRPDVPSHVRYALERAMAKDRGQRWKDVEEFVEHLTGAEFSIPGSLRSAQPLNPSAPVLVGASRSVETRSARKRHVGVPVGAALPAPAAAVVEPPLLPAPSVPSESARPWRWAVAAAFATLVLAGGGVLAFAPNFAREPVASDHALMPARLLPSTHLTATAATNHAPTDHVAAQDPSTLTAEAEVSPSTASANDVTLTTGTPPEAAVTDSSEPEAAVTEPSAPQPAARPPAPGTERASPPVAPPSPARSAPQSPNRAAATTGAPPRSVGQSRPQPPVLRNEDAVFQMVRRSYPPALAREGTGGSVSLSLTVDEHGRVTRSSVGSSSGYPELDAVFLRFSRSMQFSPATREGRPVPMSIDIALTVQP